MNNVELMIYGAILLATISFLAFILAGKWAITGIKVAIAKIKLKEHAGLLFLINKSGTWSFPYTIDLRLNKKDIKLDGKILTYAYSVNQIQKGRMFGLPYVAYYTDDSKTTVGTYFHVSDDDGNPLFYDEQTKQIPVLSPIKDSVSLTPSFFDAVIGDESLTIAIQKHEDTMKLIKYGVIGAAIGAGAAAFFGYDIIDKQIPLIISAINSIKDVCIASGVITP